MWMKALDNMAYQMKAKYDKYWTNIDNINVLLLITLVLDPRCQLDYVEWMIRTNYDSESSNILLLKVMCTLGLCLIIADVLFLHQSKKWKHRVVSLLLVLLLMWAQMINK